MSHAQATGTDPSQTPGVGLSSTASAPQPTGAFIDSDDPAWKHCSCPDVTRKHSLKCNYCQNIYTGGITRIKKHLAKIPKSGVAKCTKVPSDVKNEMLQLLRKKSDAKQKRAKGLERDRAEMDLSHSESEGEGSDDDGHYAVAVLRAVRRLSTSTSGPKEKFCKLTPGESLAARKGKGLSEKVRSKIAAQKRQEERDRVCEYICQFFYEASIPFNAVKLPSFALMLEAIGDYGPNLRGPSPNEMSAFLQKRKKEAQQLRKREKFIPDSDDEESSAHSSSDTEEDSDVDMQSVSTSSSSDESISAEDED